jgi:hypothetical protein
MQGYWCDIGDPEAYYRCCLDALHGRLKLDAPDGAELPEGRSTGASKGGAALTHAV